MCSLGCLAFMHSGFHFASHAVCARMSFNSIWVSVPASTLRWAKKIRERSAVGTAPGPSPRRCFSGGPFVLFCFSFAVLCFFLFAAFLLFTSQYFNFFCGLSHKISKFEGPQFRSEPSLSADRLTNWQPGAVSLVFCAGFATLWRLICCFHVCCIWHFPFSQAAALLSIFSICHVCLQLALVLSLCSPFVNCAPFQVGFVLSILYPPSIFAPFEVAFCLSIFSAIVTLASFRLACSIPYFVLFLHSFFWKLCINILEQAQSTTALFPLEANVFPSGQVAT